MTDTLQTWEGFFSVVEREVAGAAARGVEPPWVTLTPGDVQVVDSGNVFGGWAVRLDRDSDGEDAT